MMLYLSWLCVILAPTLCAAAELHATPLNISQRLSEVQPGDVLLLAPGLYSCTSGLILATDRVTLRGPSGSSAAILDGGVSEDLLRNRDPQGNQLTRDNRMRYDPVLRINGQGVVVENLEIRHGHVGIQVNGTEGTVRHCHVHHVSQHAIELRADRGLAEGNLVHDAILYNMDGQCLSGGMRDGSPDQNRRRPVLDAAGQPTKRHMDWGQAIQFHGKYRGAEIPTGGTIRDNLVWEIWGEGIAAYHAKGVTITGNLTLNAWRMAYYLQNVDGAELSDNVAVYDPGYRQRTRGLALQAGISLANEYEADLLRRNGDPGAPLIPDGEHLQVLGNTVYGAWYGIHSGDRSRMNRGGLTATRIDGNLILMEVSQPGITLNEALLGPLVCTRNRVWRADGGTLFDVRTPGPRTWEANDPLAVTSATLTQLQQAVAALGVQGQIVSTGGSSALLQEAARGVRAAIAALTKSAP